MWVWVVVVVVVVAVANWKLLVLGGVEKAAKQR